MNACERVPGLCRSWAWVHCVRHSSCPAAWVVRLFVSLCPACVFGAFLGRFPGLLCVGICLYGFTVSGACGGVSGACGCTPVGD
nr:MAG TPA: hypothetical protein [Caudoviricetes sp.]